MLFRSPWLLTSRGTAFNSFAILVEPLLQSPLLTLRMGYRALRLEWNPKKRRVDAVICHNHADGSEQRLEAAAVVVACGAIHSTKLLFDSACPDFPEGLGNTEGVLGKYLHDHPRERWEFETNKPLSVLNPPAYLTRVPYGSSAPLLASSWTIGAASIKDRVKGAFVKVQSVGVQVFGTMIPSETYYVRPKTDKKDAFGMPQLEINLSYDNDARDNVIKSRDILLNIMKNSGYQCSISNTTKEMIPGDSIHYGGSIRMHSSRQYGVLDKWNRVYDIQNVVVCDASCFTTGAEKNPTLTVMAIAARASDQLASDLKKGLLG